MTKTSTEDVRERLRLRGDEGASIVEFAFVLPILAMLIFSIIDFGTTYNDWQSLRSGVRDAARQAVVYNLDGAVSCPTADPGSSGSFNAPMQNIICMVKNKSGLGNNVHVGVWVSPNWDVGSTMRVCAQFRASSTTGVTGVFLNNKVMTAKVEMRIEQKLPDGVTFTNTSESAISSWPQTCTG